MRLDLTGADLDLIRAKKRPADPIDFGLVGDIEEVNSKELRLLIGENIVPVLAPLTHDGKGLILNTNADTIASEIARELSNYFNVYLFYCFEKRGVLLDENDNSSIITDIDHKTFKAYIESGIISGGMIPKLENAFSAKRKGVREVLITNTESIATGKGTRII